MQRPGPNSPNWSVDSAIVRLYVKPARQLKRDSPFKTVFVVASWLLVVACYFGALIGSPILELLPISILMWCGMAQSNSVYVFISVLNICGILVLCFLLLIQIYRLLKRRILQIDLLVLLLGTLLAVWIAPDIIRQRTWGRTHPKKQQVQGINGMGSGLFIMQLGIGGDV